MYNKNSHRRFPHEIENEFNEFVHNQLDAQGGLNKLKPGIYEIVLSYAEPLQDQNPIVKTEKDTRHITTLFDSSSFIARLVLQNQDGQFANLALPAYEHVTDLFEELIGKRVISDGESFCILGDSCPAGVNIRDDDRENLISPFFLAKASRRHEFFEELGMLRSESLRQGQTYTIKSAYISYGINSTNNVPRLFVEVKVADESMQGICGKDLKQPYDPITIRVYFNKAQEPQAQRACGFFSLREGREFVPKQQISTITRPRNLNAFLRQFISKDETPIMQVGKVYVIDHVGKKNESEAYLVFHDIEIDAQVETCDTSILRIKGVKVATIRGFPDKYAGDDGITPTYVKGRTASDILKEFNPKNLYATGKRIFSVSEDIYDGMLDYINFNNMQIGLELFSFGAFMRLDNDEVETIRRMSFAKNRLRSESIKMYIKAVME